jgi:hypothetical protein
MVMCMIASSQPEWTMVARVSAELLFGNECPVNTAVGYVSRAIRYWIR